MQLLFEHASVTDSTNAELARRIVSGALHAPFCLSADEQTAGRGRRGRSWLNTEGALMMSLCVPLDGIACELWPLLGFSAALGVHSAASEFLCNTFIKWPNDVVVINNGEQRKLCGILSELVHDPSGAPYAVIGIGLNVNCISVPGGLLQPATSLRIELGYELDIEALRSRIAYGVFGELAKTEADAAALIMRFCERCSTLGRRVTARALSGEVICEGEAVRIASDGTLIIKTEAGERSVAAADVSIRDPGAGNG